MLYFIKQLPLTDHANKYLVRNSTTHITFFEICRRIFQNTKQVEITELLPGTKFIYEIHTRFSIDSLIDSIASFSEILPEIIMNKLRAGECLLIISHSHEGYPCDFNTVKRVGECLRSDNINPNNAIVFSNNNTFLPHIEITENGVHCSFNYFESVARNKFIIDNNVEKNTLRIDNLLSCNLKNKFLCLNRVPREHRVMLLMLLHKKNLLNNFLWSLPGIDVADSNNLMGFDLSEIWGQTNLNCVQKYTTLSERKEFNKLLPSVVDVKKFANNQWNTLNDRFITTTGIYVVTETLFSEKGIPCFFTEKIFKPIFYKMPFIVVGTTRFLSYMRECGYRTYEKVWCEDYDVCSNDYARLNLIVKLIENICSLDATAFHNLLIETAYINAHNYARLMNPASDKVVADFIISRYKPFAIP